MTEETTPSSSSRASTLKAIWLWMRALPTFLLLASLFLLLRLFFSRGSLDRLLKWKCRVLVRLLGIKVHIEGLQHIDPARPYTFMFNHVTAIDHFVVYGFLPHFGKGLEAAVNFRIPIYGWLVCAAGNYPVDRKRPEIARAMLEVCVREAKEQGFSVYCAPEGTRSRDGSLGRMKVGVFDLALKCDRDIVPIALIDLHPVLPPGEWRVRPQSVTVRVLQPIAVRDSVGERLPIEELSMRVRQAFIAAGLC
jgi:1-acyl-sn-glycerol-3-phosphate acyltransferase